MKKTHSFKRGHCFGDEVNSERVIKMRYDYALRFLTYHKAGMKFIYIDEQSYNLTGRPYYGWAPKGEDLRIKRRVRLNHSLSLTAAITDKGLLCF